MEKLEKLIKESFAARREIKVDEKNDSNYRFINKKVYKELLKDDHKLIHELLHYEHSDKKFY